MIRNLTHKHRRAAVIKVAFALAACVVLFTPKMQGLQVADVGSLVLAPFVSSAQAGGG